MSPDEAVNIYETNKKHRLTSLLAQIEHAVTYNSKAGYLHTSVRYDTSGHDNEDIIEYAVKYWKDQGWKVRTRLDCYNNRHIDIHTSPKKEKKPNKPWPKVFGFIQPILNWIKQ